MTDKAEMIMFIDGQFRRLGMFYDSECDQRNEFIRQLDTRTKWWVLMRVVDYVNRRHHNYFGWLS
jgi:hypothetical protein